MEKIQRGHGGFLARENGQYFYGFRVGKDQYLVVVKGKIENERITFDTPNHNVLWFSLETIDLYFDSENENSNQKMKRQCRDALNKTSDISAIKKIAEILKIR